MTVICVCDNPTCAARVDLEEDREISTQLRLQIAEGEGYVLTDPDPITHLCGRCAKEML